MFLLNHWILILAYFYYILEQHQDTLIASSTIIPSLSQISLTQYMSRNPPYATQQRIPHSQGSVEPSTAAPTSQPNASSQDISSDSNNLPPLPPRSFAMTILPTPTRARRETKPNLSPSERDVERRLRNTESARRNRQRRREDQERIRRVFEENERRIAELEEQVSHLTNELVSQVSNRHDSGSHNNGNASNSNHAHK